MLNKILGYCKECGSELTSEDKIESYNIYECKNCYYPTHKYELEDVENIN